MTMFTIINFYSWMFCIAPAELLLLLEKAAILASQHLCQKICFCYDPSSLLFHFFALVPIFLTNSCRNACYTGYDPAGHPGCHVINAC